jgi:hypothetical protein
MWLEIYVVINIIFFALVQISPVAALSRAVKELAGVHVVECPAIPQPESITKKLRSW